MVWVRAAKVFLSENKGEEEVRMEVSKVKSVRWKMEDELVSEMD